MRSATRSAGWPAMPRPRGTGPEVRVPGGPPGTARAAGDITLGVEEEFVLLDRSAGAAVPAGPVVARMLDGEPGVQQEVMRFQVETATRACTSLDDVGRELIRLRRLAAGAAVSAGCLLVATGIAPYRTPGLAALTDQPRYHELTRQFGPLVAGTGGACGCHVHVGVPSRDLGVQVLARLRRWLAPLLAITVNSPIAGGRDTAWASCRYPAWSRWPGSRPCTLAFDWPTFRSQAPDVRGTGFRWAYDGEPWFLHGVTTYWTCPRTQSTVYRLAIAPRPSSLPSRYSCARQGMSYSGLRSPTSVPMMRMRRRGPSCAVSSNTGTDQYRPHVGNDPKGWVPASG